MSRTREIRRCFSLSLLLVAIGGIAPALNAQTLTTPARTPTTAPREHVVKKGDTLWDLAALYYGNPYLWQIIFDANRPVVHNPHWIYPVEKLRIPGRDTTVEKPLGSPVPAPGSIQVMVVAAPAVAPADTAPTRLTADVSRALISASEYLMAPWLSTNPEQSLIGRIARVADPTVSTDKIPQQLYPNDKILIGDLRGGHFLRGDSLQIVRIGRRMGLFGRVVEPLGVVRVDSVGGATVAATMVRAFGISKIGDYVMALGAPPHIPRGQYSPVDAGPEGALLEFLQSASLHGPGDLAFVSLGSDKVRIGDELIVYTPEQKIDNERPDIVPKTTLGVVRVVRVTDHSATVRVTGVRNTGLRNGLPARLVRRAP